MDNERYEDVIQVINQMEEAANPYVERDLAHAYSELGDFTAAAIHYEQAYHELSHEPDFLKEYAFFLREEGQLKRAQELLTHYPKPEPGDVEALSLLDDLAER